VTGRLKDLIIIRGRNFYPQDIEQTVEKAQPLLRSSSSAVFMIEVAGRERLGVVAEIERGRNRSPQELDDVFEAIRKSVSAEHEIPMEAIVLIKAGSIPKTSSGKIQRHACRNGFLRGTDLEIVAQWRSWEDEASASTTSGSVPIGSRTAASSATAATSANGHPQIIPFHSAVPVSTEVATIVMEHITRVAKERAKGMTLDSNILEMSMDSLERMEIVAALEDTFGGRFPEEVLPDMVLVCDVVAAVEKYLGKTPRKRESLSIEDIPERNYCFDEFPEYKALKKQWQLLVSTGAMNPYFKIH